MTINEEHLELGIAALESGEYAKGTGYLHKVIDGRHFFCCLGVLSHVAIANGLDIPRQMLPADYDNPVREAFAGKDDEELMCRKVMDYYGFRTSDPELITASGNVRHASLWNDSGSLPDGQGPVEEDFTEIAAGFRRTFLEKK